MSERGQSPAPAPRSAWRGNVRIGRVWGVPILIQPLWFAVVALFTISIAPWIHDSVKGISTNDSYLAAFGFVLLLYASVLVHELSHVAVARALGMQVRRVVLHFLGGASEVVEEEPGHPGREYLVAAVGPMTSVLLAGVGAAIAPAFDDDSLAWLLTEAFTWSNVLLAGFNLLPGLPLDGGRALRAGIWAVTHDKMRAQAIAGWVGRVIAGGVFGYALFVQNQPSGHSGFRIDAIYLIVGAFFIWAQASWAIGQSRINTVLPRLDLRAMTRTAVTVSPDLPLAEAVRRAQEAAARALVVVDSYGRPAGVVSEAAVMATPPERRPWLSVSDLARPVRPDIVLAADMTGQQLLSAVQQSPASEYLVVDAAGSMHGVLARVDLVAALHAAGLR